MFLEGVWTVRLEYCFLCVELIDGHSVCDFKRVPVFRNISANDGPCSWATLSVCLDATISSNVLEDGLLATLEAAVDSNGDRTLSLQTYWMYHGMRYDSVLCKYIYSENNSGCHRGKCRRESMCTAGVGYLPIRLFSSSVICFSLFLSSRSRCCLCLCLSVNWSITNHNIDWDINRN